MLLAPFLWIFCEFDEKVLDNLSLDKLTIATLSSRLNFLACCIWNLPLY